MAHDFPFLLRDVEAVSLLARMRACIRRVGMASDPFNDPPDQGRLSLDLSRVLHALDQRQFAAVQEILTQLEHWHAHQRDSRAITVYLLSFDHSPFQARYAHVGQLVSLGMCQADDQRTPSHIYRLDVPGNATELSLAHEQHWGKMTDRIRPEPWLQMVTSDPTIVEWCLRQQSKRP